MSFVHPLINNFYNQFKIIYVLISILFPLTVFAEQQQDLENLYVTNDPAYFVEQEVGTKGLPEFDAKKQYSIVITPTLDAKSPTGVRIPRDIREAVAELLIALPDSYRKNLRNTVSQDTPIWPLVFCDSGDQHLDFLVDQWMVVYWKLRDKHSQLTSFFRSHIANNYIGDSITPEIDRYLCNALYGERHKE